MSEEEKKPSSHFKGKSPIDHVIEHRKNGIFEGAETHGEELSGFWFSFSASLKEGAFLLSLLLIFPQFLGFDFLYIGFFLAWVLWRSLSSVWLGWVRLDRLHRLVREERWEIEYNRKEEKEELKELYRYKGFEEPLLEEVVTVLMADNDRLLKVMLEEELGLSLGEKEHPLWQGLGAFLGAVSLGGIFLLPKTHLFMWVFVLAAFIIGSVISVWKHSGHHLDGWIWQAAIFVFCLGTAYLLSQQI